MVAENTKPAIPLCPACGKRHRRWRRLAGCRWPRSWAIGEGRWASVSYCGWSCSVELHATRERAERAKRVIDETGCGGRCSNDHHVHDLGKPGRPENR